MRYLLKVGSAHWPAVIGWEEAMPRWGCWPWRSATVAVGRRPSRYLSNPRREYCNDVPDRSDRRSSCRGVPSGCCARACSTQRQRRASPPRLLATAARRQSAQSPAPRPVRADEARAGALGSPGADDSRELSKLAIDAFGQFFLLPLRCVTLWLARATLTVGLQVGAEVRWRWGPRRGWTSCGRSEAGQAQAGEVTANCLSFCRLVRRRSKVLSLRNIMQLLR